MIDHSLITTVRKQFAIDWHGIHGIRHWSRVYANGMRLADGAGANHRVVALFALFHDSCRWSEGGDPEHGPRGAELAISLGARLLQLGDDELELLVTACRLHTSQIHHDDPTVGVCFDADRLDLGRVGKRPDPALLCTESAKEQATIRWAYERSIHDHLPRNVLSEFLLR